MANNQAGWLSQTEAAKLLGAAGIKLTPSSVAHSAEEAAEAAAAINRPVAMKIIEPPVLHKTDVGGVVLNVTAAGAADGYNRLAEQLVTGELTRRPELIPLLFSGLDQGRATRALTVLARAGYTQPAATDQMRQALGLSATVLYLPDGTMARPVAPDSSTTSTSTVGLPRESST